MKILIIDYRNPERSFSLPGHECIVSDLKNALLSLITEEPDVIFAFVEYCTQEENKVLLEDVKRSMSSTTKFVRLGFLEEVKTEGEVYLRLPYSREDLNKVFA
jgi:hypothetical protein